jgi:hypothetical protein
MTYEIKAHHTAHLTGTLAATGSLFIESSYGFNGGVAYLSGTSENDGSIFIDAQGGYPAGTRTGGGTLINQGVLTNVGRITVAGGGFYESRDGGDGGALINDGSLLNSGYIILGTAYASSLGFPGSKPGLLQDNGVLHNVGVIGINDYYDSYYNGHYGLTSGRLEVAGSLVNDGRINIGAAGYGGATIAVSGLLQNHAGGYVGSDAGGWALDVSASGIVQNAGTMVQGYTAPNYAPRSWRDCSAIPVCWRCRTANPLNTTRPPALRSRLLGGWTIPAPSTSPSTQTAGGSVLPAAPRCGMPACSTTPAISKSTAASPAPPA